MKTFLVILIATIVLGRLWIRLQAVVRERFIRNAELPGGLTERLISRHPHLTREDCGLVTTGLRQFFLAYLKGGRKLVSMPSRVVDDLWHELILNTRDYATFCRRAFGRFLHHTPAASLGSDRLKNEGLRRCWWFACREEGIDPRTPARLPLLFALDAKLGIAGGFLYAADCSGFRRDNEPNDGSLPYCGGDFSSTSYDGGTDGLGDDGGSGNGDGGNGCGGD